MKIVRFAPNERVDMPDMTAVSFLPLSEFRRTFRGAIVGDDTPRIINGFKVEANSPNDAGVTVTLDPGGGGWPAHAVLAEDTTFGQLVGGIDDQGSTEGNATYPVDFTGEPAATYVVEMRFVYVDGDTQNRAFINQVTKIESTQQTETRYLPTLEVQLAPAPTGAEWVTLAEVVWGGATISSVDITDMRVFALEGTAGAFTASAWGGAGGQPDFDRSTFRADVGLNAIWPAIRACMRQIQDLKGFSAAGTLDSYSRVIGVPRAGAGLVPTEQTRSVSSMDTEEFTVGDGAGCFGDFNGSGGLQDCLDHIVSQKAFLPKHITIKVKTRSSNTASARFVCDTPVDLSGVRVTIECVNGNNVDGMMRVDFTHAAGTYFTSTTSECPLEIRNMRMERATGVKTVRPLINCGADNSVVLHNCDLNVSRTLALPMVIAGAAGSRITSCTLAGEVQIGSIGRIGGCLIEDVQGQTSAASDIAPCVLRLYVIDGTSPAKNVTIRNSSFRQIIGHGARYISIEDVTISHGHLDGIQLGASNSFASSDWTMRRIAFTASAESVAGHVATNGADGTGWAIHCFESIAPPPGTRSVRIVIEDVVLLVPSGTDSGGIRLANVDTCKISRFTAQGDHGVTDLQYTGIELETARNVTIEGCDWEGETGGDPADFLYRCVDVRNECSSIHLRDCIFDGPDTISASQNPLVIFQRTTGTASLYDVTVESCRFLRLNTVAFSDGITVAGNWSNVHGFMITGCTFNDGTNDQACIDFRTGPSSLQDVRVLNNTKRGAGNFMLVGAVTLRDSHISGNTFTPGTGVVRYFLLCEDDVVGIAISNNIISCDNGSDGAIRLEGINDGVTITDNQFDSVGANALADLGTVDHLTLIGNYCTSATGEIIAAGAPTNHIGWNDTTLNRAVFVP